MKTLSIILASMLILPLAHADNEDPASVSTCTQIANTQNLTAEEHKAYVAECVKDIAEVEKEEADKKVSN